MEMRMVKAQKVDAYIVCYEPGDLTRYEFIAYNYDENHIKISSNSQLKLGPILLEKRRIKSFFKGYGKPPKDKGRYKRWVCDNNIFENSYFNYVFLKYKGHNIWTLLASFYCAFFILKTFIGN